MLGNDGADIVQLVGRQNQARRSIHAGDLAHCGALALGPSPARALVLATGFDDPGHLGTEPMTDLVSRPGSTLVLDCVMQQRRDALVFAASGFHDQGGYRQQVGDVRHGASLAPLMAMQVIRIGKRRGETFGHPAL